MSGILWLLIYVGLFYFMMRYGGCCGGHASHGGHTSHGGGRDASSHEGHRPSGGNVISASQDPVCGMAVSADDSYAKVYRGREYRFCSSACLDRFENDPEGYLTEERRAS
jgi:Cu+-exporting ATPase